MFFYKLEI